MTENPYAPPETKAPGGIPDAPKDYGWNIRNGKLAVRVAAQLPMVDPFHGGSDETMMLQQIQVRHLPRWMWLIPLAGAFALPLLSGGSDMTSRVMLAIPGLLLGHIGGLVAGGFRASCSLRVFIRKKTLRNRRLHDRITLALFLLILPGALLFQLGPDWMMRIPGIAFPCWVVSLIFGMIRHRRLKCRIRRDGFFEITGVHPQAIRELSAMKPHDG
jgi:hypothetical protein